MSRSSSTRSRARLPLILPVVFYQGASEWHHSTEFADLFPAGERAHDFLPRFAHHLIDQSQLAPEAVQGGLKVRVAQLLMMAAYRAQVQEVLRLAAPLMAQLTRTGGLIMWRCSSSTWRRRRSARS
jgi:hypothetical protein